jgi:hypothetical protein
MAYRSDLPSTFQNYLIGRETNEAYLFQIQSFFFIAEWILKMSGKRNFVPSSLQAQQDGIDPIAVDAINGLPVFIES